MNNTPYSVIFMEPKIQLGWPVLTLGLYKKYKIIALNATTITLPVFLLTKLLIGISASETVKANINSKIMEILPIMTPRDISILVMFQNIFFLLNNP